MRRGLVVSLGLAVVAALMVGVGELLGFELQHMALMGTALGGALAVVRHEPPLGKLGGFLLGFVAVWLGYALRAAVLPDSATGRAVSAFLVLALIGAACAVSSNRLPLWSGLLGAVALVGAYEETFTNAPSQFLSESFSAATAILFTVAFGYLAVNLLASNSGDASSGPGRRRRPEPNQAPDNKEEAVGIDGLMAGDRK